MIHQPPNQTLQPTLGSGFSSASRFTSFDSACLSSGRLAAMRLSASIIAVSLLLAGCDTRIPTASDHAEATNILNVLEAKYPFRVMTVQDRRPAVFMRPHAASSDIVVCGDYSKPEQDDICAVVRTIRADVATKPINLFFYPRENKDKGLLRKEVFK